MQLELPKRLNSILPTLKWNLTFYFSIKDGMNEDPVQIVDKLSILLKDSIANALQKFQY